MSNNEWGAVTQAANILAVRTAVDLAILVVQLDIAVQMHVARSSYQSTNRDAPTRAAWFNVSG